MLSNKRVLFLFKEKTRSRTSPDSRCVDARSQIEKIQRTSQWARQLGTGVTYLPWRVGGKLHVFKVEKGDDVNRGQILQGDTNVFEEGCHKVISVESFLKTDFVR